MKNPIPYRVKEENLKFYRITQIVYFIGLIGHISAFVMFWVEGFPEMARFNLFFSIPAFTAALILNRLGLQNLAFTLAFFELLFHQVLGTYYFGWETGLQFWLFYLAALSFFNPRWKWWVNVMLLTVVIMAYTGLYFHSPDEVNLVENVFFNNSYLVNAITALILVPFLINYFAKSTQRAERKLQEEKEITEMQNEELRKQHQALATEQDKTSRMLNKIESLFGQQVSREVASEMIKSDTEIDSKNMEVTVMFLDIRDFTVFADSREPEEVAKFQNTVFSELIDIVSKHNGIVNQILGDGIYAVFGAPVASKTHVTDAVNAGYDMIERIQRLGDEGIIPPIKVGIGLNAGKVMAGNVGNEIRKSYSLAGSNVIIAARIEQLNKQYNSQFLVSESIYSVIREDERPIESIGKIALKGIENKVEVFKLV